MERVKKYLLDEVLIKNDDIIVIGNSGGPDSMALMNVLEDIRKKINIKIVCAHVNHNVRKESYDEKMFLENYCKDHNILFEFMVIEEYGDDNFHNEARTIRYKFFDEIVNKYSANYLMTAHHGDDLMETILMRITRGSTLKGYSGFDMSVNMGKYMLVRPLVFMTKKEIEDYDKKNKIPYVIDQSNFKDKYTRNRYRKNVLPFLKSEDSKVHEKFLKFSKTLIEYNDFIEKEINKQISRVYKDNVLFIDKYNDLDKLIGKKIIYSILEEIYQDDLMLVNDIHVNLIIKLINSEKANSELYLPNNIKIVKNYDKLKIERNNYEIDNYEIEIIDYVLLPNGKKIEKINNSEKNDNNICRLKKDEIEFPLHVRTRLHGDRMELKKSGHRKVKDIFIDSKIPIELRDIWPIVVDSKGNIIWIPGLKKSKFTKSKNEKYDIIYKYY